MSFSSFYEEEGVERRFVKKGEKLTLFLISSFPKFCVYYLEIYDLLARSM